MSACIQALRFPEPEPRDIYTPRESEVSCPKLIYYNEATDMETTVLTVRPVRLSVNHWAENEYLSKIYQKQYIKYYCE